MMKSANDKADSISIKDEVAKKVIENLPVLFDLESQKRENEMQSSADSGYGDDSIDSWQLKAENIVNFHQ